MNGVVAVPEKVHASGNAPSEAGQQEADADQGTQRDDKSESGRRERRGRHGRKGRRCDFCLTHGEDLQEIQLVLEIGKAGRKRAARPEFICSICRLVSVALGTHGFEIFPWTTLTAIESYTQRDFGDRCQMRLVFSRLSLSGRPSLSAWLAHVGVWPGHGL
jgi:hypothetical protein